MIRFAEKKLWALGMMGATAAVAVCAAVLPKAMERRSELPVLSVAETMRPLGHRGVVASANETNGTMLLQEDFSRMTAGSELQPSAEGMVGEIPSTLTGKPGWLVATGHQAGGSLFVDDWQTQSGGETITVSLLDTPAIGAGGGAVKVSFRARWKSGSDKPFYIINANKSTGVSISTMQVNLTSAWEEYEVWFTDCVSASFFEFQSDMGAFYIDDIKVEEATALSTPHVLPATDITPGSYMAHWSGVNGATGYLLYPRTMHVSDGMEPYKLIDADFEKMTEGTVDNPVEPTYVIYSLDEYIDEAGWLVRLPLMANSALGLTNKYLNSYGNSLLQSPTLNLSHGGGSVDVTLRYLAQDVDMFQVSMYQVHENGSVSLRATKMVYTYEDYNVWKEVEFSLGGGTASSMLVILLPETTRGTVFFDRITMSQTLPEGTRYTVPGATITTSEVQAQVLTPDAGADDSRSYSVKAYQVLGSKVVYSEESNSIMVGADSDELPESLDVPQPQGAEVRGAQFHATWPAVAGANAYEVLLYRRHVSNGNETVAVVDENFDRIRVGTTDLDYPRLMHEDGYDRLDDFTNVPGWEVFQGFYVDGAVGVLGYWNMLGVGCYMKSPIYDLSGDSGNMTLSLKVGTDYYEQGATVYLAHDNPETGATVYDDILPLDEMSKGFHPFTTTFTKGRKDSYLVFFPYGYGMSYFDDIKVTQRVPAGVSDTQVSRRVVSTPEVTMTVPQVNTADQYFFTVRALWLDNMDNEKVGSQASAAVSLEGLVPATYYTGKITDADGNAVAGATVTLRAEGDNTMSESARSNRWGLFRVENISRQDVDYTATITADGYRTAIVSGLRFTGLQPITDAEIVMRPATDDSREIGLPDTRAEVGALYLQYNNSDTQTVYSADMLDLPAGTVINSISYDGYCETEKEVKANVSISLANETSTTAARIAPVQSGDVSLFWEGQLTLNQTGSAIAPDELLHFENAQGFLYNGGDLRVCLQSRASKNSDFYFLTDSRQSGRSIYRYWSRNESQEWFDNEYGMPVMRIAYTLPTGVQQTMTLSTETAYSVRTVSGGVELNAHADCTVEIYAVSGVRVASVNLRDGQSRRISLEPGIYMAGRCKIVVR